MATVSDPSRARARLDEQLATLKWLRGTGPNPFEYDQWDSRTAEVLAGLYGVGSAEVVRYREAVDTRGRLPGVRGQAENMTLNIHGEWGILGRLERAEALLASLLAALPA